MTDQDGSAGVGAQALLDADIMASAKQVLADYAMFKNTTSTLMESFGQNNIQMVLTACGPFINRLDVSMTTLFNAMAKGGYLRAETSE
jgi:hypothetical protein